MTYARQEIGAQWTNGGYRMHGQGKRVHRTMAENALGRLLDRNEVVHHIDEDKCNNAPANLLVCTRTYHLQLHARLDCQHAGFDWRTHALCSSCKTYHLLTAFSEDASKPSGVQNICKEQRNAAVKAKNERRTAQCL